MYRDLLKRAWDIIWHNKKLWLLGFFASLLSNSVFYDLLITENATDRFRQLKDLRDNLDKINIFQAEFWQRLGHLGASAPATLAVIALGVLLFLAITAGLITLVILSHTVLLSEAIERRKNQATPLLQSLKRARKYFWRVLSVTASAKILLFVITWFVSYEFLLLLFPTENLGWRFVMFLAATLVQIALYLIFQFTIIYGNAEIILKNKAVGESIRDGIKLFLKNWVNSIEFALILFLLGLGATLASVVLASLLSVPFVFVILLAISSQAPALATFAVGCVISIFAASVVLENALFAAFQVVALALLFHHLARGFQIQKLSRSFFNLFKK